MITCHKNYLAARCQERGYTLEEVMACVVSQAGDQWTIDVDHPAYPMVERLVPPGVGTQLKKLLGLVGIKASASCSCNKRAKAMDVRGIQWCKQNKAEIVGWLREEAKKRRLPFIDAAGYVLLNCAIAMAKWASKK